jgi:hypothetical protein
MANAEVALKKIGQRASEIKGTNINLAKEYEEEDRI